MAWVGTDHAHHAVAADDAAVLANATNGTTYFHGCLLYSLEWSNECLLYHIAHRMRKGVFLTLFFTPFLCHFQKYTLNLKSYQNYRFDLR